MNQENKQIDLERISQAFTSTHWRWEYREASDLPKTLLDALQQHLTHIAAESWPARHSLGGLFVNGAPADLQQLITVPSRIEYFEPHFDVTNPDAHFPAWQSNWVVYEDEYLIATFKPAGLPCMPGREQSVYSLKAYLERHCKTTIHMPSRLDLSTSGLVIASKHARMHNRLQRTFENRTIQKSYLTEVSPKVSWHKIEVNQAIGKEPQHPVLRKVRDDGKPALTTFKLLHHSALSTGLETSLLMAMPKSGRTHQIRIHCAWLGSCVVGDNFYGGLIAKELRLLSYKLALTHPFTQQALKIELPRSLCPEWAWTSSHLD